MTHIQAFENIALGRRAYCSPAGLKELTKAGLIEENGREQFSDHHGSFSVPHYRLTEHARELWERWCYQHRDAA
jgi:hypothetical protein